MTAKKGGKVGRNHLGLSRFLCPGATAVVVLPKTVADGSAWVKRDLGLKGFEGLVCVFHRDSGNLDDGVLLWLTSGRFEVKKDELLVGMVHARVCHGGES